MPTTSHARLRWHCRRGMLELDLLLLPFLEKCFSQLSAEEQAAFEQLLTYPDQELYQWLTNREKSPDPALAQMVQLIIQHAQTTS